MHWLSTKGEGPWTEEQARKYPWYDPNATMVQNLENLRDWDKDHGQEPKRPIFRPNQLGM